MTGPMHDAATVYGWMVDPDRVLGHRLQWGGLGYEIGGRIVAGVVWSESTATDVRAHLRVDRATKGFLVEVFRLFFHRYGFLRITMPVADDNARCLKLVRALGAVLECVIPKGHGGGDVHQYVLWRGTGVHRRLLDKGVLP